MSSTHELERMSADPSALSSQETQQLENHLHDHLPPTDHGKAAYVALTCCTLAQVPIWGYSVSFGIFQEYYTSLASLHHPSPGAIATVGAAQQGVMYLMMPLVFIALHHWPHLRKWCSRVGLVVSSAGLASSAFLDDSIASLIVTQGALYSIGCGLLFSPISMYMDEWFVERKGFALGVMWAGKSAVGVAMPFIFKGLLDRFGLRATLLAWAISSVLLTLPMLFLLRPRIPWDQAPSVQPLQFGFLRHAAFWMMQIGIVIQSVGYLMPSTYLASYASAIGLPSITGPIFLALFSCSSIPGGIVHGMLGDKFTATKVILLSSIGSAVPVFLLWGLDRHVSTMVVFVLLYGFFAGGFSSTWSSMIKEVTRASPDTNTSVLFGMLMGGRGIGFVVGGPLSGVLLGSKGLSEVDGLGYATKYGALILFTGVTGIFGAWAPLWKVARLAQQQIMPCSSRRM